MEYGIDGVVKMTHILPKKDFICNYNTCELIIW